MSCESVRERLLDHLYGALEDDEEREVLSHLGTCAACRAALEETRVHGEELAAAARLDLPGIEFRPPEAPRRRLSIPRARRVAVAAAVLLAAVGVFLYRDHLRSPVLAEHPRLVVRGPGSLPPDAASEFLVRTETLDGDAIPTAIRAVAWNGEKQPVLDRTLHSDRDGRTRVEIPPGLGKPGDVLQVDLLAAYEGGENRIAALVTLESSRLAAYVATDKPLYRPGEPIRCRAVVLSRFRLSPAGRVPVRFKLVDPRDNVVREQPGMTEGGIGEMDFHLPPNAAGGAYRVVVDHPQHAFAETDREITVRAYRVPTLKTELELDRDSYGPGEQVTAFLSVERSEGGVPDGATVEAVVKVDGEETTREDLTVGKDGRAAVTFTLPASIREGRGQISCTVKDGGSVEGAAKTIPITLDRLHVDLYPEGGDLVAGLESRVYLSVSDRRAERGRGPHRAARHGPLHPDPRRRRDLPARRAVPVGDQHRG
jgi:hypothetical protein